MLNKGTEFIFYTLDLDSLLPVQEDWVYKAYTEQKQDDNLIGEMNNVKQTN